MADLLNNVVDESERFFRELADFAPVMIWRAGTDKLCDWFNKPWLDFVGRTMEQELGNGWAEGVHEDDFARCLQIYTTSFDARQSFSMIYRLRRRDGEFRYILDNGAPFYRSGTFAGYFGSCIDVTEQSLQGPAGTTNGGDARPLQLLIDAVVDYAIYMIGTDGRVLSWNSGARRLKGYAPEEIIGKPFSTFYTPEDREAGLPARALKTAREEGRFLAEGWRVRKDGTRFWASVVIDAIKDEQGTLIGFAKVTRDVTERQLAQQHLLESERQYRRLVEAVTDYAIFQLDKNGIVATWNAGAKRNKGYEADEIIGKHFSVFYPEEDRAAGVPERALQTAAETGRFEAEGWRVRKDGSKFWANVVIDAIFDDDKKLVGFAKVTRDITERREAQQILQTTQERLAGSQKMEAIGQLSGGIAHDFNNLMMIVLGNLETVQRHVGNLKEGTANLQRAIANATRGAQRAAALTSRLLAFSRRQPLDPKPLDVSKFVTGAVDFLQRSLGETVDIEAVGNAGLWSIDVDVNHLESALVNLAINARDAMPNGGKLTIEAANTYADAADTRLNPEVPEGQYVALCVTDTGAGMPADVVQRAFELFLQQKSPAMARGWVSVRCMGSSSNQAAT
jgi:PAS domain S-box-containing protein